MSKVFDVAVVGATGAVGETMLRVLHERKFPVGKVYPLASSRSAGKRVDFGGKMLLVEDLDSFDFSKVQIGLFSAGGSISEKYAPIAAEAGCVVVDNTSHYRYDDDIPLVVPEVNPEAIAGYTSRGIIANPNCSTIQMLVALKPIHDVAGITRVNVCTYQAVSGTGKKAIDELFDQSRAMINFLDYEKKVYPHRIAFNCLPHIDSFLDNGYTKEEMKMVNETRKIMEDNTIGVTATTVRVPVFYSHAEAVNVETIEPISASEVKLLLEKSPGIKVMDDPAKNIYPLATDGAGQNLTLVGRIRDDISHDHGISLWVVADNVRKGAALNSIQIAEILVREYI